MERRTWRSWMARPIRLFVSSSPELYAEREIVGEVIAALPLTIGWRIGHTSIPGETARGEVASVDQCDLYALVLGQDFAAPMGVELRQATAIGRTPLAFRGKAAYSPSAQDAIRRLSLGWREFSTPGEFRASFERALMRAVIRQAVQLGLELNELERLIELSQEAERTASEAQPGRRHGDAGRSGVILGREVWESGN